MFHDHCGEARNGEAAGLVTTGLIAELVRLDHFESRGIGDQDYQALRFSGDRLREYGTTHLTGDGCHANSDIFISGHSTDDLKLITRFSGDQLAELLSTTRAHLSGDLQCTGLASVSGFS